MKKLLALISGIIVIIVCFSLGVMRLNRTENTQTNSSSKKVLNSTIGEITLIHN